MNVYMSESKDSDIEDGIEGPDVIHAEGSPLTSAHTLCGHMDRIDCSWTVTKKKVTCATCLDIIRFVQTNYPTKI